MTPTSIESAVASSAGFRDIDRHFARLVERLAGGACPELALAAALVSRHCGEGHICLDLGDREGLSRVMSESGLDAVNAPAAAAWIETLRATAVVGRPGEVKPLVLDARGRLYLHRYWEYETNLAQAILSRATAIVEDLDESRLGQGLDRFFPPQHGGATDWQKVAACTAVLRRFCVISGGPGTGKTRTVAVLLALMLEQAGAAPLRVALAAPTGKAAARLQESISQLREQLPCADSIKEQLPETAFTVHRLLGGTAGRADFRHDAENPLPFDVVVVDEASMVDLALMAKLFAALPEKARIILLGDKDQLASVEAGKALGDICAGGRGNGFSAEFCAQVERITGGRGKPGSGAPGALADCVVQLEKNHRFAAGSGILELSRAVNGGDAEGALAALKGARGVSAVRLPPAARLKSSLKQAVLEGFSEVVSAREPAGALAALRRFRILTALRRGPFGAESVNGWVEEILHEAGLIARAGPWYPGRPVMVTENDYNLRLFNGDVGVIQPDAETGQPRVFFADGPDSRGGAGRGFAPARLPRHETVFAMTVHKSQGSEFRRVLLLLPDRESPVLTRELIYTGVTRASESVEIWLDDAVFRAAVAKRVERVSGLREALWPE